MAIDFQKCTEEELWKYVAWELARHDIDVVLVGGAVVSIYSKGAYRSGDLDFVLYDYSRKALNQVLSEIGFQQEGRFYKHPDCTHLFLEFASFPASIGDDYNITPDLVEHKGLKIKIFSPTDCVRDRLANFAYFHSRDGLEQALIQSQSKDIYSQSLSAVCHRQDSVDKSHHFLCKKDRGF